MERFWPTASRILKPGGTVAFFTIWRIYVHPALTPNAEELQKLLFELEQGTLGPYQKAGNWCLMGLYNDLQMPWSLSVPQDQFPQHSYRRQIWNENGLPEPDGTYVCGEKTMTIDEAEKAISTISAVTRWREAHSDIAHTDS
jgi:trans-aconitate 3-methyltransferase